MTIIHTGCGGKLEPWRRRVREPGLGMAWDGLGNPAGNAGDVKETWISYEKNRQELGFQYVKHVDFAGENEEMNWIPEWHVWILHREMMIWLWKNGCVTV